MAPLKLLAVLPRQLSFLFLVLSITLITHAQTYPKLNVGNLTVGTQSAIDPDALLDVRSTTKGVLHPRMSTTEKNAISTPTEGLQVYDSTTHFLNFYNGSEWLQTATLTGTETLENKTLTSPIFSSISNTGTLTLPTSTDTLVGRDTTDTLTNKTISGLSNTLTNIDIGSSAIGTLPVANGGTGLTSGTSGGLLGFTATGVLASSSALTANQLIVGGGAGVLPSTLAAGTQYQVLTMGASNPGYGALSLSQSAATTGQLPTSRGGTGQDLSSSTGALSVSSGTVSVGVLSIADGGTGSGTQNFVDLTNTQTVAGAKTFSTGILVNGYQSFDYAEDNSSGTNIAVDLGGKTYVRLTNAALDSVGAIDDTTAGRTIILTNATGGIVTIQNEDFATPDQQILTGTGEDLELDPDSSLYFLYDTQDERWRVVGGSGKTLPDFTANRVLFGDGTNIPAMSGNFIFEPAVTADTVRLNVGNVSSSSNGIIVVGGSGAGVGTISGGGGALNIDGGPLTLITNAPGQNITIRPGSTTAATFVSDGSVGIGGATSPTAKLHLPAGTATAGTAPLKFTSGTNLTVPAAGAVEFNGTNLFVTPSTTRETVVTSGAYTGKGSLLSSSASNTLSELPAGTNNYVLKTDSSKTSGLKWAAESGGLYEGGQNLILNNSFEADTTGWTASGGTFQRETGAGNIVPPGIGSFSWDPSTGSETLSYASVTITANDGLSGRNGVYSCAVKTAATDLKMQVYDGTNVISSNATSDVIPASSTGFIRYSTNFIFPTSGTLTARFLSQSNSVIAYGDNCFFGLAEGFNLSQVSQAQLWGTISWAGTASCDWTTTSGSFTNFSANPNCPTPTTTGNLSPPSTKIPGFQTSFPPGDYFIVAQGASGSNWSMYINSAASQSSATGLLRFSDGAKITETTPMFVSASSLSTVVSTAASGGVQGHLTYTAASGNVTVQLQALAVSSATIHVDNTVGRGINIYVYRFPTSQDVAYRADLTDWFVIADIAGANPSLGTSSVSSYTGIENGSLTMNPVSGSAPVGIMCSSTNAATAPTTSATTCAAGNESIGANFNIPVAGWYEVCSYFGHSMASGGSSATVFAAFQMVETATNAQTIVQECGPRITSTMVISSGETVGHPVTACGQCYFSSSGTKGVRLMYEQSAANTITSNAIPADADASVGQRSIRMIVKPLRSSLPTPLLVNSVVAPDYAGVTKINTVRTESGSYTATVNDETIIFTGTATLSLPPAANVTGKKYTVVTGGNLVTIDPNSSETICGVSSAKWGINETVEIQSNGSNWIVSSGSCDRSDSARINCDASAAVTQELHDFISSVGNRVNGCAVTLQTGIYSATPNCQYTQDLNSGTNKYSLLQVSSATSIVAYARRMDDGSYLDHDAWLTCQGPR